MTDSSAPNPWIEVRQSAIHGSGVFAKTLIPSGTRFIEYVGERIDKAEALIRCEAENHYIFEIDDTTDLDGNVEWNPARFINHSCNPNCESSLDEGHIWLEALRDIPAGTELSFNYGYGLEDYQDHPCRCGADNCVGYIVAEAFFEKFQKDAAAS